MTPHGSWIPPMLLLAASACSGIGIQPGTTSGIPGTAPWPGVVADPAAPRQGGGAPGGGYDQICRNQSIPRYWVATDYVASTSCPPLGENGESGPNSALLIRHAGLPPETVLTVCADQRTPTDWSRERSDEVDGVTGRCPRKPGDTRTSPTVVRIRRLR